MGFRSLGCLGVSGVLGLRVIGLGGVVIQGFWGAGA